MTEYIKKEYVVNTFAIKKALGYYIKQGNEYNKIIKTSYSEEKETFYLTFSNGKGIEIGYKEKLIIYNKEV